MTAGGGEQLELRGVSARYAETSLVKKEPLWNLLLDRMPGSPALYVSVRDAAWPCESHNLV
jgi:hypothetical protein